MQNQRAFAAIARVPFMIDENPPTRLITIHHTTRMPQFTMSASVPSNKHISPWLYENRNTERFTQSRFRNSAAAFVATFCPTNPMIRGHQDGTHHAIPFADT